MSEEGRIMGYERALRALNLEENDRIPNFENVQHPEYILKVTSIDPFKETTKAYVEFCGRLDLDMILAFPSEAREIDGVEYGQIANQYGELVPIWLRNMLFDRTRIANVKWGVAFTTYILEHVFRTVDEAISHDFTRAEPRSIEEIAEQNRLAHGKTQKLLGKYSLCCAAWYYTLFQYPLELIGWPLLARVAYEKPKEFDNLLEGFAELSMKYIEAWSRTDIHALLVHDDIANSRGPMFSPKWFRHHVFPWYKKMWEPVKRRGIKLIFYSDGDTSLLLDDIIKAGADGFAVDTAMDLKKIADQYGDRSSFFGNIDTRILTYGGKSEVVAEVKRCVKQAGDCNGYFFRATGELPHNVPISNMETYFKVCRKYGKRK